MKTLLLSALAVVLLLTAPATSAEAATGSMQNPVLLTDVGQGNNAKSIRALLRRSQKVQFEMAELARAADLAGKGTLVIAVGASTKGLGAAGLDVAQEMARLEELLAAAEAANIPIVAVHIGGESRRGELSDVFTTRVVRASQVVIVWEGGNEDGYFTNLAAAHNLDLRLVDNKMAVGTVLESLFP